MLPPALRCTVGGKARAHLLLLEMAVRWDCGVKLRDMPKPAWEGARYRQPPHLHRLPLIVTTAIVVIAVIAAPSKIEKKSASQKSDEHVWLRAECIDGGGWGG